MEEDKKNKSNYKAPIFAKKIDGLMLYFILL